VRNIIVLEGGIMNVNEAKELVGYCGAFCGTCMLKGRIYTDVAKELLEMLRASEHPVWVPKHEKIDFNFDDFMRGLEYFSNADKGPYCQAPCKDGGGAPCKCRPCAKEKGIKICYECEEFPCEHLSWLIEKHPEMIDDCKKFKEIGVEEWLKSRIAKAEKGYLGCTGKYYTKPQGD
jgi:hypothetical protein